MLVSFLFWNVFKQPLETRIARIAAAHSNDVIMLAECEMEPSVLLAALNATGTEAYHYPINLSPKIRIFTRFPEAMLTDQYNDVTGRLTIRRLRLPSAKDIFLSVVHMASKINFSDEEQSNFAASIAREINRVEALYGNDRSILVGDFNMNPFDKGIIGAHGFHAVMTKQQARKLPRTVQGTKYGYFYNPMWGHFGDRTDGPSGTYYLSSSRPHQYFWNMYDQVLLRPSLMDKLKDLEILDSDGVEPLVTSDGRPHKINASDHLPLLFRLEL